MGRERLLVEVIKVRSSTGKSQWDSMEAKHQMKLWQAREVSRTCETSITQKAESDEYDAYTPCY